MWKLTVYQGMHGWCYHYVYPWWIADTGNSSCYTCGVREW
jgi:hypothetical protein